MTKDTAAATGTAQSPALPGRLQTLVLSILIQCVDLIAIVLAEYVVRQLLVDASILLYTPVDGQMVAENTGVDHFLLLGLLATFYLRITGHYRKRRTIWDEANAVGKVLVICFIIDLTVLGLNALPNWHIGSLVSWFALFLIIPMLRALFKIAVTKLGLWQIPTVVIGCGDNARQAAEELNKDFLLGYQVVKFYEPELSCNLDPDVMGKPVERLNDEILEQLQNDRAPHVIIALEHSQLHEVERIMRALSLRVGAVDLIPPLKGIPLYGMEVNHLFGQEVLLLRSRNNLLRPGPRIAKRVLDLIGALLILLMISPIFLYLVYRIRKEDAGPAFYVQERVGLNGKPFGCIKFRSMRMHAEKILMQWKEDNSPEWQEYVANNFKLENDPRVTPIGRKIRGMSLDELPQLLNVIKGDMSLVGPRPFLEREMEDYGQSTRLYMRVRPGITGLWQVSGRSLTTFQDRAAFDAWYIKNWSLWYDFVILIRTIQVVFNKTGSY